MEGWGAEVLDHFRGVGAQSSAGKKAHNVWGVGGTTFPEKLEEFDSLGWSGKHSSVAFRVESFLEVYCLIQFKWKCGIENLKFENRKFKVRRKLKQRSARYHFLKCCLKTLRQTAMLLHLYPNSILLEL